MKTKIKCMKIARLYKNSLVHLHAKVISSEYCIREFIITRIEMYSQDTDTPTF